MADQSKKSAVNNLQDLFNPQGYQEVFKTLAETNERATSVVAEAATRSTDIVSKSAKEAFSNLREVSQVREEPTEYAKAYTDFVQKQMDLLTRTARAMADVSQRAGTETAEMAKAVGEEMGEKATANAQGAAEKATSAAKKAA